MKWHGITTPQIKETEFYKISPSLLYILSTATKTTLTKITTNSKQIDQGSNLVQCPMTNENQLKASAEDKKNPLGFFQSLFGSYGNTEEETEESLENLLVKINGTIGDKLDSKEKVLYTQYSI